MCRYHEFTGHTRRHDISNDRIRIPLHPIFVRDGFNLCRSNRRKEERFFSGECPVNLRQLLIILQLSQTRVTVPLRESKTADLYKSREHIGFPPVEKLNAFRALVGGAKTGNVHVGELMSEVRDSAK